MFSKISSPGLLKQWKFYNPFQNINSYKVFCFQLEEIVNYKLKSCGVSILKFQNLCRGKNISWPRVTFTQPCTCTFYPTLYGIFQRCANSGFSAPAPAPPPATLQLQYPAPAPAPTPAWLANWGENPTGYYSAQLCSQGFLPVKAAKL